MNVQSFYNTYQLSPKLDEKYKNIMIISKFHKVYCDTDIIYAHNIHQVYPKKLDLKKKLGNNLLSSL